MVLPINISLKDWAHSLIVDYPNDNIPILTHEADWQTWGGFVIETNSFAQNNAPRPANYPDWQSWAKAIFSTMNNT